MLVFSAWGFLSSEIEGLWPQDFWFCFLLVMDTVTSVATVLDTAEEELV